MDVGDIVIIRGGAGVEIQAGVDGFFAVCVYGIVLEDTVLQIIGILELRIGEDGAV